MNKIKNFIFLVLTLFPPANTPLFAMKNNREDDSKLWIKKEQRNHAQRMQMLLSSLMNNYLSLVENEFTQEEISTGIEALGNCQENAFLSYQDIMNALNEHNQNIKGKGFNALHKAFTTIVNTTHRIKHSTDEIIISWFKKCLYKRENEQLSLNDFSCFDNFLTQSNLLIIQRDIGEYVFYKALNILDPQKLNTPKNALVITKKRKIQATQTSRPNNNNNRHCKDESDEPQEKKICCYEENYTKQKTGLSCRFGCTLALNREAQLKAHYLSSQHRACPYCPDNFDQFINAVTRLEEHLKEVHPDKKEIYICDTCDFASLIGLRSNQHENTASHRALNP